MSGGAVRGGAPPNSVTSVSYQTGYWEVAYS